MSSEGRGSAGRAMLLIMVAVICLLIQYSAPVHGATYTVGGSAGWTFNSANWPKGKRFRAGDVLAFNYDSKVHNVVSVNEGGYSSCTTPAGAKVYQSGKEQIKLVKGQSFFICNYAGHCESGMKIAVNAV
ncbi:basic blue protein-like [Vitis riparia]|uniref:basic blue protein-like n=1 Tax=Vitis riparia TaxID=96939 RepID=UPI00155A4373|nr:basic blue protein-like [Vitis riparia]